MSKLTELENFLLNENSTERKNYEGNILSGKSGRPEEEFISRHLGPDFWKELGYDNSELGIQERAGDRGFVEIALTVDGKKIAVECKQPFDKMKDQLMVRQLKGEDYDELKNQIGRYLSNFDYVIFTNGFFWYFYSKTSYLTWDTIRKEKPYFQFFKAEQIFKNDSNHILNFLSRQNIVEALYAFEQKAPRHELTNAFFEDLQTWINVIDESLKDAPADTKARTTSLINKLIFVRTMEGVGTIPNGFLASIWNEKKGIVKSTVKFIDQIDDELSDTYNTELFNSRYIEDEDGEPVLENGIPKFNPLRAKNFAFSNIPEEFFSAILKQRDDTNTRDTGFTRVSINGKQFNIKSLYWWKFEAISADILGRAYETYLARKRKKLGIYYTPHQMTSFLTKKTVNLVFDKKISELKSELGKKDWKGEKVKEIANSIVNTRICDPSCGSGSFLIQAMRFVWQKYTEIVQLIIKYDQEFNSGKQVLDEYFTEKSGTLSYLGVLFRIKNERERIGSIILRHIYGNDMDVNAVDTAKLNIWLECLRLEPNAFRLENVKGKKHVFPNLALNLTTGNSLIGLNDEDADNTLSDQKQVIKSILGIRKRYSEDFEKTSIAQDSVRLRDSLGDFLDLDFEKKIDGKQMKMFLEKHKKKFMIELVKILNPTHWSLQHIPAYYNEDGTFKESEERGFDVIIGNPPWEILKPNDDEFFSQEYDAKDIEKFRKLVTQEKEKIKTKLLQDSFTQTQYEKYEYDIKVVRQYFAQTETYQYQKGETINQKKGIDADLYKLFLEKYYQLLKKDGVAGIVLPAGLLLSLGSTGLRCLLLKNNKVICLYVFENKYGIFDGLHRQYRFMNLVFQKGDKTKIFDSIFHQRDINSLNSIDANPLKYDVKLLEKTSPNTLAILEFRDQVDLDITKKLYSKFPLINENPNSDWRVTFQREFDMTDDRGLFNTNKTGSVLFEGKMIHQFVNNYTQPRYWVEVSKGKKQLMKRQEFRVLREIKNKNKKISKTNLPEIKIDYDYFRLGWRDITNSVDHRTLICTILPPNVFVGKTISYMRPNYFNGKEFVQALSLREIMCLCGLFNSIVVDFIIRHRVGLHATMSIVSELPIPRLKEGDKYFSEIVQCVGKLICTTPEYDELKKQAKIRKGETDEKIREEIIAQLNVYVAKIYGVNGKELQYILDLFHLIPDSLKEKIIAEF